MAKKDIQMQQERLRLKSEELKLRVAAQDQKEKLAEVRRRLKTLGGRIR